MEALTCPGCFDNYDMEDRCPKAVPCGHSVCLSCLRMLYQSQGRLQCPTCSQCSWVRPEEIPDNQSIKDILAASGMRGAR